MASNKIRFGIIGAGWMGSELMEKVLLSPDAEIRGVYEPDVENARVAKGRFQLTDDIFVGSVEELMTRIDAMVIASPNDLHGVQSIAAMEKGIHVFCEKPAATRFDELVRQKELDERTPHLVTFVDYILQFDDMEQRLHGLIEQKVFGEISHIQINYRHAINIAGKKIWKTGVEAIGMGPIHALHLILWHMHPHRLRRVYSTAMEPQGSHFKIPPIYDVHLQFDNGATGIMPCNIETPNGYDVYHSIYGSEGWFVFDPQAYVSAEDPFINFKLRYKSRVTTKGEWIYPLHRDLSPAADRWPAGMSFPDSGDIIQQKTRAVIDHFIDCIKKGEKSPLGFSHSFKTAEAVFAILVSARTKQPVDLPLQSALVEQLLR